MDLKAMDEYRDIFLEMGRNLDVPPDVHPEDLIFQFVYENPAFPAKTDAIRYYFNEGARSAKQIGTMVRDILQLSDKEIEVFEFASGYGCVSRHLKHHIPHAKLTSCDIHESAVAFLQDVLDIEAVLSTTAPEDLTTPKTYDLVFALSFFSHMPRKSWTRWMHALLNITVKGGFLLFTTHGLQSMKHFGNPELDSSGFWFDEQSEQTDLSTGDYGQAIALPRFVMQQIFEHDECELAFFQEAAWWGHQDLYVLRKL